MYISNKWINTLFPPNSICSSVNKYVFNSYNTLGIVQSEYFLSQRDLYCSQKYFRQVIQRLKSLLEIEINMLVLKQGAYNIAYVFWSPLRDRR